MAASICCGRFISVIWRPRPACKSSGTAFSLPHHHALRLAGVGKWLGEPILSRENLAMLNRGSRADSGLVSKLLGLSPARVNQALFDRPTLACFAHRSHA